MFVVIAAHDRTFQGADSLDAFMRIRVVADDITEANEMSALAFFRIGHRRVESLKVGVDVAENREAHFVERVTPALAWAVWNPLILRDVELILQKL